MADSQYLGTIQLEKIWMNTTIIIKPLDHSEVKPPPKEKKSYNWETTFKEIVNLSQ